MLSKKEMQRVELQLSGAVRVYNSALYFSPKSYFISGPQGYQVAEGNK